MCIVAISFGLILASTWILVGSAFFLGLSASETMLGKLDAAMAISDIGPARPSVPTFAPISLGPVRKSLPNPALAPIVATVKPARPALVLVRSGAAMVREEKPARARKPGREKQPREARPGRDAKGRFVKGGPARARDAKGRFIREHGPVLRRNVA